MRSRSSSRTGAALLIVLATLVVSSAVVVALARTASTAVLGRTMDDRTRVADDILLAADAAIVHWLDHVSSTVILPPDATEPRATVLVDTLEVTDVRVQVRITGWDQCGMLPLDHSRPGSLLRTAIPPAVLREVDRVRLTRRADPGLDNFPIDLEFVTAFPPEPPPPPPDPLPSIGALVATHNRARINVFTAPLPLVDAALRRAGRGGLEQIVQARTDGRRVPISGRKTKRSRAGHDLTIASSSDAWSFRVDVRVGLADRSWWLVYVRTSSTWKRVQRLVIAS